MQYDVMYPLDKKVMLSTEEILSHAGKVVLCRKFNDKEFVTRLMGIEGNDIVFRTKNGHLIFKRIPRSLLRLGWSGNRLKQDCMPCN